MSKKRPDSDKLANELMGASAFFRPTTRTGQPEPAPAAKPTPAAPSAPVTPEPTATSDAVTSRRHDVMTSSTASPSREKAGFDINRPTASRDSLRLSMEETKAIDKLHQALKWDHDLSVSKNDIYRAALHSLLEDWSVKGSKSTALTRLKRKQSNR